jgi:nucleoside-diphosphate-sugar epimerase
MVLIAGVFAGFAGSFVRQRLEARKYHLRVYDVSDLLVRRPTREPQNWEPLIREIKVTVAPETWDDVGGLATIECFPTNQAIVVFQKEDVHNTLTDVLVAKRRVAATGKQ